MGLLQVLSERNKRQQRRAQLLDARSQGNLLLRLLQEGLLRANYHLHRPHSQRPHSGGVRLQGKPVSEMLFSCGAWPLLVHGVLKAGSPLMPRYCDV